MLNKNHRIFTLNRIFMLFFFQMLLSIEFVQNTKSHMIHNSFSKRWFFAISYECKSHIYINQINRNTLSYTQKNWTERISNEMFVILFTNTWNTLFTLAQRRCQQTNGAIFKPYFMFFFTPVLLELVKVRAQIYVKSWGRTLSFSIQFQKL